MRRSAVVVLFAAAAAPPTTTALQFGAAGAKTEMPNAQPTSRRALLRGLGAAALLTAPPARAIIAGSTVSVGEAAASGAVALWIDLEGCEVCRHDVPAACSGALVGPRLVLSAQHCVEIPESLNGTLSRVGFGNDIFDPKTQFRNVARYVRPGDVGLATPPAGPAGPAGAGPAALPNDLVLVKLAQPAPPEWRVASIDLADEESAAFPKVTLYGFGDTVDDPSGFEYSAGELRKVSLAAITPRDARAPAFYTVPSPRERKGEKTGSCNGDSGGAALAVRATTREGTESAPVVLGVLSSNSMPCAGSTGIFMNPAYFREFLRRGSAELGEPSPV